MSDVISLIISSLSLIVACAAFIVHHQKHIESRHLEIIRLKRLFISECSDQRKRIVSILTNLELTKLELRKLPETDFKYNLLERIASLIKKVSDIKATHDKGIQVTEGLNTKKLNFSSFLLDMQSHVSKAQTDSDTLMDIENDVLLLLADIQKLASGENGSRMPQGVEI